MKRGSVVGSGLICMACGFAGVTAAGAHTPPTSGAARSAAPLPDVTVLIGRATARVRATDKPQFRRDVLYEADGSTRGGRPVSSAAGVVSWRFVFDGTPGSKYASATLTYGPAPKRFGKVVGAPLYIFTLAPKFVAVNTVTGKVSVLS
jgi:hypothetical protein